MQKKKVGHKVLNYTLGKVTLFSFEILLSFSFCTVKKRKKKKSATSKSQICFGKVTLRWC